MLQGKSDSLERVGYPTNNNYSEMMETDYICPRYVVTDMGEILAADEGFDIPTISYWTTNDQMDTMFGEQEEFDADMDVDEFWRSG